MSTLFHIFRIILFDAILVLMIVYRKKLFTTPTATNLRLIKIFLWIILVFFVSHVIFFFGVSVPSNSELGIKTDWIKEVHDLIKLPAFVLCFYFSYKNVLKHHTEPHTSEQQ